ncbi:MAG: hypothetical protein QM813_02110 [Verrucomicrobiota bacterium]
MSGAYPAPQHTVALMVSESTHHPAPPTLVSVPLRQRNCTFCPAAELGRFTSTVLNVAFVPLQPARLPSALAEFNVAL